MYYTKGARQKAKVWLYPTVSVSPNKTNPLRQSVRASFILVIFSVSFQQAFEDTSPTKIVMNLASPCSPLLSQFSPQSGL